MVVVDRFILGVEVARVLANPLAKGARFAVVRVMQTGCTRGANDSVKDVSMDGAVLIVVTSPQSELRPIPRFCVSFVARDTTEAEF